MAEKNDELKKVDQLEKKNRKINDAYLSKSGTFETTQGVEKFSLSGSALLQRGGKSKRRKYTEICVLAVLIITVWMLSALPTLFHILADVSPSSYLTESPNTNPPS